jgi:hypothetical protein
MTHHYPAFWPALWGCDRALSSRWRLKGSGGARPQYSADGGQRTAPAPAETSRMPALAFDDPHLYRFMFRYFECGVPRYGNSFRVSV